MVRRRWRMRNAPDSALQMIKPPSRRLSLFDILASLGLVPTAAPAADAPQATLYTGATVIDGTGGAARADQDILVEGERIVAIRTHDALANQAGTARRVDLSGRFVIPGDRKSTRLNSSH